MNKNNFMKSLWARTKDHNNLRRGQSHPAMQKQEEPLEFKHTWGQLAKMHDLRMWHIAYAPTAKGGYRRMQEIHYLNNEMWEMYKQSLWKRLLIFGAFYVFMVRWGKNIFMNGNPNYDSHETNWRPAPALYG